MSSAAPRRARSRLSVLSALSLVLPVALAGGALIGAGPASASNGAWAVVPSPVATGGQYQALTADSCTGAAFCMAVGYQRATYFTPTGFTDFPLVETWNGSHWSVITPPPVTAPGFAKLDGVSCTSSTFCMVVGEENEITQAPLAAVWNGSTWSTVKGGLGLPVPVGYHAGTLNGVSCITNHTIHGCMTVGSWSNFGTPSQAMAIYYYNGSWTDQGLPHQGTSQTLAGVSCQTNAHCLAVGSWTGSPGGALLDYLGPNGWATLSPTLPYTTTLAATDKLTAVSCVPTAVTGMVNAAMSCMAVGGGPAGPLSLLGDPAADTWEPIHQTTLSAAGTFTGVSCTPGEGCDAVGSQGTPSTTGIVAEWAGGSSWRANTLASLGVLTSTTALSGISCVPATSCTAVGATRSVTPHTATVRRSNGLVVASTAPAGGYWLVAADGGIFSYGAGLFHGSTGGMTLNAPIVAMAATPPTQGSATTQGYWLAGSDGGIFNYGTGATFYGSTGGLTLNKPIVGMAVTPDGKGYWLVAADGGIFSFGDATFYGSTGGLTLNKPIVGMAVTPDGHGYYLVAADGGIFSFGDAVFYGSTGGVTLNEPIVGMAVNPTGDGYWLVASDGGIFSYGPVAHYFGSTGGMPINAPIVGMTATPDGAGYRLLGADGGIYDYGDAKFYGSTGSLTLNKPIVGMAATGT